MMTPDSCLLFGGSRRSVSTISNSCMHYTGWPKNESHCQ